MSESFKPGQTVWHNESQERFKVLAYDGGFVWCWRFNEATHVTIPADRLTATDPNAEPTPKACPFCGSEATVIGDEDDRVLCMAYCVMKAGCGLEGPFRKTRREAVQAWNSIRIIQPGEFTNDLREALKKAAAECEFKPADSDPLTEEWLRKVGLRDGLVADAWPSALFTIRPHVRYFVLDINHGTRVTAFGVKLETIGDARTFCRLLGVPLKE